MSKRPAIITGLRLCVLFCIMQAVLKFYNAMPAYGVKNKSFNILLNILLSNDVPKISVADASAKKDYVFLDVREKEEFEISHLPAAHFVGYKNFSVDSLKRFSKEKNIVVYCSVGKRSEAIAKKLNEAGYSNVHNLVGGIFEWVNQGKPVYQHGRRTKQVHAYNKFWGRWINDGAVRVY